MTSDPDALPPLPPIDPAAADRLPGDAVSPELLASLLADGDDELASWVLEQALTDAPRVDVYDGLVADAMALVGERWANGQWSVAEEHLASQTLMRTLDRIRPRLGTDGRIGPLAVLAGVAGEQHMLGLVCLAHLLMERGWTVSNLGADVPTPDLVRFLARNEARLLALSASDPERIDTLTEAVHAARATRRRLPILIGGRVALEPSALQALQVDLVGTDLRAAVRYADDLLAKMLARA